jgi:hypothetical protein
VADSYVDPATVDNPTTAAAVDFDWADTVNATLDFMHSPPAAKAILTASQSISNATVTTLDWDVAVYDNGADYGGAMWEGVTNPSRLTVPTATTGTNAGRYLAQCYIYWGTPVGAATEYRYAKLVDSGTTDIAYETRSALTYGRHSLAAEVVLSEGDYITVQVAHDVGTGAVNILTGSYMTLTWLGVAP